MNALIRESWSVGKSVNDGPFIHMGSYDSQDKAEQAAKYFEAFHLERCPKDHIVVNVLRH